MALEGKRFLLNMALMEFREGGPDSLKIDSRHRQGSGHDLTGVVMIWHDDNGSVRGNLSKAFQELMVEQNR